MSTSSKLLVAACVASAAAFASTAHAAGTAYRTEVLSHSPSLYFEMDEAHTAGGDRGTAAHDSSANATDGVYGVDYDSTTNASDNVTLGSSSASSALNTAAAVTAGVSDRFDPVKLTSVSALNAIGTNPFTIQFWFKTPLVGSTNRQDLFDFRGTNDLSMQVDNGVAGGLTVFGNSSPAFITTSAGVISADTWYMVTLTRDASDNLTLYLNGSSLATGTDSQDLNTGATGALAIGNKVTGAGHPVQGSLDEFAFYNTALSASDVATLYSIGSGTPVPEPASLSLLALGGVALLARRRKV
jgi:hypothetical protein